MTAKPMTKALHTVRVVRAIAELLMETNGAAYGRLMVFNAGTLLVLVCDVLGNATPADATLLAQCLETCDTVIRNGGK